MVSHYVHTHGFDGFFADKVAFEYRIAQAELDHMLSRPGFLDTDARNKMEDFSEKCRKLHGAMMWALGEVNQKYREEESVRSRIYRDYMEFIQSLRKEYLPLWEKIQRRNSNV